MLLIFGLVMGLRVFSLCLLLIFLNILSYSGCFFVRLNIFCIFWYCCISMFILIVTIHQYFIIPRTSMLSYVILY